MRLIILFCTVFTLQGLAQNEKPIVSNLEATLDPFSSTLLLSFDLEDAENDPVELKVYNQDFSGKWLELDGTGDIGIDILPGAGKEIYIQGNFYFGPDGMDPSRIKVLINDHQYDDIQSIVDQVDSNRIYNHIDFLQDPRHRISNPDHLEDCRNYIAETFDQSTDQSSVEEFSFFAYTGQNFIGILEGLGNPETSIIVDAHYDSVSEAPGADDNASGVAGVLEVLEVLKEYDFERSVNFIAFDLEEEGLRGSIDYATKAAANDEDIMGVINFEMIGYYTEVSNSQSLPFGFELLFTEQYNEIAQNDFRGDFITNVGTENLPDLMICYDSLAEIYVPDLSVISFASPGNGSIVPDLQRSDHSPFWFAGYDAIMLTDAAEFRNPNYHMSSDSLHVLNMEFAANVVKAAVATVIEKSGMVHGGVYFPENLLILNNEDASTCDNALYFQAGMELILHQNSCEQYPEHLKLYTLDGRIVLDTKANLEKIDVGQMKKGIYLIELQGERNTWKQKILIHR